MEKFMNKKPAGKKSGKSADNLVVGSKIKVLIKAHNMKCSGDLMDAISATLAETLSKAVARAQANKRSTIRPCDL